MNVVTTIQHPGHVHFFKNAISVLSERGHDVHVFARENEMTVDLLDRYGIDHEVLAGRSDSLLSLAAVQATYETRLLRRARRIDPDVITAIGGVAAAHVASAVGARSVVFYDTEHATIIKTLAYPFADTVCTPACYRGDVGDKQVRYPGYHELAYLHPDRFTPDADVLEAVDADPDDRLVVVRVSSWDSSHDVGQGGFDDVHDAVDRLEAAGARVLLTSEVALPDDLESRRISIAPERIHDLLYHADLVIGEGATTATESAVLGTPAVYVNSLSLGYTEELEERYGLLFNFNGEDRHEASLRKAASILRDPNDERWARRRETLLEETVDVTDVVVDKIESPPGDRTSQPGEPDATPTRP
ncbi:DUF354 domain-containing protein [Halostella sp. PRR32]|uniref:DUF354 domain-containing protein n=1 Tax=Halostella sp. PRR32 TaxID=3098147 RepID=UPI002B1DA105|nr:DUF354 domain-containing protein [Halostella sp. PRR32]